MTETVLIGGLAAAFIVGLQLLGGSIVNRFLPKRVVDFVFWAAIFLTIGIFIAMVMTPTGAR